MKKLLDLFKNENIEQKVANVLFEKNLTISTAESCTGGLVSSKLTDISGSSAFVKSNFVTYANEAKHEILGVSNEILEKYGAVSEQCAFAMAEGLMNKTHCDIALCTTGIAGPTGAEKGKPVGTMFVAAKNKYATEIKRIQLSPKYSRKKMKEVFSQKALEFVLEFINKN